MAEPILMSIREVAKLLGVSERAIWQWEADGNFPPVIKLGRLRRWRQVDIERFLSDQVQAAKQEGGAE